MRDRFVADENVSAFLVRRLREAGVDVIWIAADRPGATDLAVFQFVMETGAILITHDKDFGPIGLSVENSGRFGVILLRSDPTDDDAVLDRLVDIIVKGSNWLGNISVVEPGRIRIRSLGPQ